MTQTPTARLRAMLRDTPLEGRTAAEVADELATLVPLGDAAHWMRQTIAGEVRRAISDRGLVITHRGGSATGEAMAVDQLPLPDLVDTLHWRRKQIQEDQAALDDLVERWLSANPGSGHTRQTILALVESEAA